MESLIITLAWQIIQHFVTNPGTAAKEKAILLRIRNDINTLFPGE